MFASTTSCYLLRLAVIRSPVFVPMSCSNNNGIVAVAGLCKVAQWSFNPGNELFGETVGIQCTCMALLAIPCSAIKERSR